MKEKGLQYWLGKYYELQQDIVLVYRPTLKSPWSDRCAYLREGYSPHKPYNHRSVLNQEVIIEYDLPEKERVLELTREVARRLSEDKVRFAMWDTTSRSIHLHVLLNIGDVRSPQRLKRAFILHYTRGLPQPDLQLTAPNHLIRAEGGVHEKTGKHKFLLQMSRGYGVPCEVPEAVWEAYRADYREYLNRRVTREVKALSEHPGVKFILASEKFRECEDGRERALFMLIHVLKPKYQDDKEGLTRFLQDWYRYSGGVALSAWQIKAKVNYHWERHYSFTENYVRNLLEELGRKDVLEEKA